MAFACEAVTQYDNHPGDVCAAVSNLCYQCRAQSDPSKAEALEKIYDANNKMFYVLAHGAVDNNNNFAGIVFDDSLVMTPSDLDPHLIEYDLVFLSGCDSMATPAVAELFEQHFNTKVIMGWTTTIPVGTAVTFGKTFFQMLNTPAAESSRTVQQAVNLTIDTFTGQGREIVEGGIKIRKGQNEVIDRSP
jgi:hypothetical protein